MPESAWRVVSWIDTPSGRRYTVVLGDREWLVLHAPEGWQYWNGHARCETNPAIRAALLDFEKHEPYDGIKAKRFTTTMSDIAERFERDPWPDDWGDH